MHCLLKISPVLETWTPILCLRKIQHLKLSQLARWDWVAWNKVVNKNETSKACWHGGQWDAKRVIPRTSVSATDTQPGSTVGWGCRQCLTWSAAGCSPRLGGNITGSWVGNLPGQLWWSGHSPGNGNTNISERTALNQSTGRLPSGLGCSCWLSEPSLTLFVKGWACTQLLLAAAGAYTHTKTFATLCLV